MADTPPLRKFMFDRSFDGGASAAAPERARTPVTLKPEQLDALKKEAYDLGVIAGKKAGGEESDKALRTTLSYIDKKIDALMQNFQNLQQEQDVLLREAIMAIARKLLPDYTARHGLQEIQVMLTEAIAEMVHEPRMVVRINESEFDAVNTKIHEITVQKAYAGKVVVLADETIALGDCRIEWADGGIERNVQTTWKNVEDTVAPGASQAKDSNKEIANG